MKRHTVCNADHIKALEQAVLEAEEKAAAANGEYHKARVRLAHALLAEGDLVRSEHFRVQKEGSTRKQSFDWRSYARENGVSDKVIQRYMRSTYHNRRLTVVKTDAARQAKKAPPIK
ncbi:hypothetical protein KLER11_gp55 [Pararheinheimera phage vB_PsoM_KLER1-1]|nr:hypothetical protein KLER11_gp55 [Pararheinheimera phage vB_PsoM_KLER1-1]